jgi:hypothetical protein
MAPLTGLRLNLTVIEALVGANPVEQTLSSSASRVQNLSISFSFVKALSFKFPW